MLNAGGVVHLPSDTYIGVHDTLFEYLDGFFFICDVANGSPAGAASSVGRVSQPQDDPVCAASGAAGSRGLHSGRVL